MLEITLTQLAANIEQLADIVRRGFASNDQRFDAIDKRFETIDQRFDAVDQRFASTDQRFDTIDRRFDAMDQRFDALDQRFDTIDQRFDALDAQIEKLASATYLEFMAMREEMATKDELRAVDGRLSYAIGQVDAHLSAYATQWNREFEGLHDRVEEHDGRLRLLEKRQAG